MKNRLRIIWYYVEIWFAKIRNFLKFDKSELPIPKDTPYCYERDFERDKKEPIDGYWIKPCKYYRSMKRQCEAGCTYVGFIGWDLCLGDQCKICNIE